MTSVSLGIAYNPDLRPRLTRDVTVIDPVTRRLKNWRIIVNGSVDVAFMRGEFHRQCELLAEVGYWPDLK